MLIVGFHVCNSGITYTKAVFLSLCRLDFVNLAQSGVTLEEGTLIEELPPSDWSVSMSVGHFLDLCGRAQLTLGCVT